MAQLDRAVREARWLHFMLALCIPLYAYAAETIPAHPLNHPKSVQSGMLVATLVDLGILAIVRLGIVRPSAETLRLRPDDARAVARWRVGSINTSVLSEAVAMYGAVFRFLGGTFPQAALFYVCALLLMLLFIPRSP